MAKIKLKSEVQPGDVLGVARSVVEEHGYLWEPDGAAAATASEGGRPVGNRVFAMRLRMRLQVEGDTLELKQETSGVAYTGGADNPYFQIRIAMQARKLRKATAQALTESGLA